MMSMSGAGLNKYQAKMAQASQGGISSTVRKGQVANLPRDVVAAAFARIQEQNEARNQPPVSPGEVARPAVVALAVSDVDVSKNTLVPEMKQHDAQRAQNYAVSLKDADDAPKAKSSIFSFRRFLTAITMLASAVFAYSRYMR